MSSAATTQPTASDDIITMLADSAADFCARALTTERLRELRGATPAFDRQQWHAMAELGWLGVCLSEDDGGLDLGAAGATTLSRALGRVAAPEPLIEAAIGAGVILSSCKADAALLDALLDGSNVYALAANHVDDDPFVGISGAKTADGASLDGVATGVPLGAGADGWIVPIRLVDQPAWVVISTKCDGLRVEPRILGDGATNGRLEFSNCPAAVLASGELAERAWRRARALMAVAASAYELGLAETLYETTKEYVTTRDQFGQAIGSFQSLQHRLVDGLLALRLAEAVLEECVTTIDSAVDPRTVEWAASRARQRCSGTVQLIGREAIQLHGAIGYTDECDVGLFVNRALAVGARYGRAENHSLRCSQIKGRIEPPVRNDEVDDYELADSEPPNGDWNALDNDTFRQIVRQWHSKNYPDSLKNLRYRVRWEQCREWYGQLYERGFAAPGWPAAHGGMGLAPDKLLIFIEERERLGVVRTPDQGIIMVGPLLMQHGTPEQQAYYLPKALSGEHIWCQGYSEPNAGSDLASLKTSAVRDGDEFVINGQKIWTTMAQDANQMFCLVRTDPKAKPQSGISFVLIDFDTPGITVRPIRNIAGDEEFCEVFFDDVRVPCSHLVGELNDGWTIAKALLGFERFFIGSPKFCRSALSRAANLALAAGLDDDPVTVHRYTKFELDVAALESLYKRFADQIRRGEVPGADISLLKIFASETFQALSEFVLDLGGGSAAELDGVETDADALDALFPYYHARPTTIYGGSNEIQRNIIAKLVLRLPSR